VVGHQLGQLDVQSACPQTALVPQLLRRDIEVADVVVAVVEEVADLLERHRAFQRQRRVGGRVGAVVFQLPGGVAQPAVDGNQAATDLGHASDEFFDLGAGYAVFRAGLGEQVGQVCHQPGVGIGGEVLRG
jgi:hypothetical protein